MNKTTFRDPGLPFARKNIVIIGGGTGTFTLLSGLRKYKLNNTVIVSSSDNGGSTGILRKELGVMPPGDIRQCLLGLSYAQPEMQELFNFRFEQGSLKGHALGNIILAGLEKITGNVQEAVAIAADMLSVRGQVLPVSLKATTLSAKLKNGKVLHGEHSIDEQNINGQASAITELKLTPGLVNPQALKALQEAHIIVFGPGDLFTSILPNLLVKGVKEAVNKSRAKKVLVTNIMTKFGQTDGFKASDFVLTLEKYLNGKIDYVLANNHLPPINILKKYAKEKAEFVQANMLELAKLKVETVAQNFISDQMVIPKAADKLKRSFLRHNSDKVAQVIWNLI